MKPVEILLVEDNEDHAELLIESLTDCGVQNTVRHVSDGERAIDYLQYGGDYTDSAHAVPDLILLDIKMPKLNGIETLRIIKNNEQLKLIPVIMISTSSSQAEINTCFELGANSYVTKPLQFDEFSRKIKQLNLYWVLTSELPKPA